MQLPLFQPETDWRPPSISELPEWGRAGSGTRVAIDVETRDPNLRAMGIGVRRDGYIVGISFAIEDGPAHYLPIRHAGGDNLDEQQVLGWLRAQSAQFKGDIVGAHLPYDLDYLAEEEVHFPCARGFRDIQVADPLIYELHDRYSLQAICERLGLPGKDETELRSAAAEYRVNPKDGMWQLPGRHVGRYAIADVQQPLLALRRQERLIDEADLWRIWELECRVLPVLVRMRRRGIRVNEHQLEQIEEWSLREERGALLEVDRLTGCKIAVGDVWQAAALAPALESIGVTLAKTPRTGQPSINKDLLTSIDHPVAAALARARKVNKLRTTFAASIRRYTVNGRVHCTLNQIARENEEGDQRGARYGRLSSEHPNMQQQLARDEFAKMWRSIYEPEEGEQWASCDYSQQEPRWTTHFAALMNLAGAREAARAYHENPDLDNHQFMADLTGLPRGQAKNVYLGLCYGEGGAKLCRDLGLPTRWCLIVPGQRRLREYYATRDEAFSARAAAGAGRVFEAAGEEGQQVLDTFDERAPFIRLLARKAEEIASKRGYIVTGGGRHLHFPLRSDGSYDWTHKALNRLIQGTSADQTKEALVQADAAGLHLLLQVHDEIPISVSDRAQAEQLAEIMTGAMVAEVPFKVDIEIGANWGDSMK